MPISASLNGQNVTIANIQCEGNNIIISYINSSNQLRVTKLNWAMGGSNAIDSSLYIASGASII